MLHTPEEVLGPVVEPCERLLGDMTVDPADATCVVRPPWGEIPALAHNGEGFLLFPPRIPLLFERVVPQGLQLLLLPKKFSLLIRKRGEAVPARLMHRPEPQFLHASAPLKSR